MVKTFSKAIERFIFEYSKNKKNKKIIDVGCGTGFFTSLFGKNNDVIGVDLQDVIDKKNLNFKFEIADGTKLPYKDGSLDLYVSLDVIEHIQNDKKFLKEAFRVLKKGGRILIGTPNKNRLSHQIFKLIGKKVKYPLYLGKDRDLGDIIHVREYSRQEFESLISKVGFKEIKTKHFWFGITAVNYGLNKFPRFLEPYSHYLFVEAVKH